MLGGIKAKIAFTSEFNKYHTNQCRTFETYSIYFNYLL